MNKFNKIQSHYNSVSASYNDFFSDSYMQWVTDLIVKLLCLHPDDIVADIGGGTGSVSHLVFEKAGLKNKVLCVDPSDSMLAEAGKLKGVKTLCLDAHSFAEDKSDKYDKILVNGAVHHFADRILLWNRLSKQMNKNGRLLIITRPETPFLPFFKAALTTFSTGQPASELLAAELEEAGFQAEVAVHSYSVNFEKNRWYYLLRSRFMSNLHDFTDDEIEDGIAELEQVYSGKNIIRLRDDFIFIMGILGRTY
ncbi:MAG: class I SAM-dependent methyltransferase [Desulfobacteraceae bacterium]|nr:class I SAM-dependent methyltransferase [Desulfobacteraceae bacterium]